ncbi:carbon-nitrogen hydrolase family protein [Chryseobacterium sp.]|uniref:carbon-nitrogen hydrolase family protein n=1 Tax=Chryseobacterium sp. TaxID=1871047 RepID=UPI00388D5B15
MKISVAQTNPIKGNVKINLQNHLKLIEKAIDNNVELIIFPELSLTGYEPELAKIISENFDESKLDIFQKKSDEHNITIGIGLPTMKNDKIFISMIIFQPCKEKIIYSKQNLFPSEKELFTKGNKQIIVKFENNNIFAPAICYEISDKYHSQNAKVNNASIYIASVLNSKSGIDDDLLKLSSIAKEHNMTVMMSNFIGESGGYDCAGKSSLWNNDGRLIEQLNDYQEGILIYDTINKIANKVYCP